MLITSGKKTSLALEEILVERLRQINSEGWSEEHDDEHREGELAMAAACYATWPKELAFRVSDAMDGTPGYERLWPWDREWDKREKHDQKKRLAIAGALIVAELERLMRK
jgi:hypothetical protein